MVFLPLLKLVSKNAETKCKRDAKRPHGRGAGGKKVQRIENKEVE
jgi:hypothetical protein